MWENWVWYLGWEDPLEKGKVTHSSILAWRIPWTWGRKESDMTEWFSLFPLTGHSEESPRAIFLNTDRRDWEAQESRSWVTSGTGPIAQTTAHLLEGHLVSPIFPAQEWNRHLLCCWRILYQLSYMGSPKVLRWRSVITSVVIIISIINVTSFLEFLIFFFVYPLLIIPLLRIYLKEVLKKFWAQALYHSIIHMNKELQPA